MYWHRFCLEKWILSSPSDYGVTSQPLADYKKLFFVKILILFQETISEKSFIVDQEGHITEFESKKCIEGNKSIGDNIFNELIFNATGGSLQENDNNEEKGISIK